MTRLGGVSKETQSIQAQSTQKLQTPQSFLIQTELRQSGIEFSSAAAMRAHTPHNLFRSTKSSSHVKIKDSFLKVHRNCWDFGKAINSPVLKLLLKSWRPIFLLPTNCPYSHPDAIAKIGRACTFWATICTEADTPRQGGSWFCCRRLNWEGGLENMRLADAWASHHNSEWGKVVSKSWSSHLPSGTPNWFLQPSVSLAQESPLCTSS